MRRTYTRRVKRSSWCIDLRPARATALAARWRPGENSRAAHVEYDETMETEKRPKFRGRCGQKRVFKVKSTAAGRAFSANENNNNKKMKKKRVPNIL